MRKAFCMLPKRTRLAGLIGIATLLTLPQAVRAQASPVVSPEVMHTSLGPTGYTVTFRYYAPDATRVRIRGEWYFTSPATTTPTATDGRLPEQWKVGDFPAFYPNSFATGAWPVADLTKDQASGVWSITMPMPSGTYSYSFFPNCAAATVASCTPVSDPANPPWNTRGSVELLSQVYVPQDTAFGTRDYTWQAPAVVPHGTLVDVPYPSALSTNPVGSHDLAVYTPPGYDANRATAFPLLILSHGAGGHEVDWSTQGVAGRILDNAIAAGKMQPAVVAMTNFNGVSGGVAGYSTDVIGSVVPCLQSQYNVSKLPSGMAFGGLSAGGARANDLIFNRTTAFGYFGSWSNAGGVPASGSPLYQNPDLKKLLGLHVGTGLQDPCCLNNVLQLEDRLTAASVPYVKDNMNGTHTWEVWRTLLYDFVTQVAFRATATTVSAGAGTVTAVVTPATAQPIPPAGTVQFKVGATPVGSPVQLSAGRATIAIPNSAGQTEVTATYSGDALYNTSSAAAAYSSASTDATVGGSVGATLSLTLGIPAAFGAFTAGVARDYLASTTATVISTAGDATLSVADPSPTNSGKLVNGTFALPQTLQAGTGGVFAPVGGSAAPTAVKAWSAPTSNEAVPVMFRQSIAANDALRTGAYSKTLTFALSTTTP
jgi:enterochelin esterase-like enzyme